MRSTVVFEVTGENFKDLREKAVKIYQEYMNDPEATPPPGSFHIDVSRGEEIIDGVGGTVGRIADWAGRVTITNNTTDL